MHGHDLAKQILWMSSLTINTIQGFLTPKMLVRTTKMFKHESTGTPIPFRAMIKM